MRVLLALIMGSMLMAAITGCGGDPNIEGAKLDLRNQDYERALMNVEAAIQNNPDNAEAWKYRGITYQELARQSQEDAQHSEYIEEMMRSYNRAIDLDSGTRSEIEGRLQIAWVEEYQRGLDHFERGAEDPSHYEQAATYFRAASAIQPDSVYGYINEAYSLIAAGRHTDALRPLEQAIERGDDSPETRLYLAELYFTSDRPMDAVETLERAREEFPDNDDVMTDLLNAYIRTDNLDRAMTVFSEAVQLDPENRVYRYNYGSLLLQADRFEDAIQQLQMAVDLDPMYANAWYNLGAAYQNRAVETNDQREELEDQLRAATPDQRAEIQQRIDQKTEEMRADFRRAIDPLERARGLLEEQGEDPADVCQALFRAYVQVNEIDSAREAARCAGIDMD